MENRKSIAHLEALFLSRFELLRSDMSAEYPTYTFQSWSSATGSMTSYQGHDLGLECIFPDAEQQESNCVAAIVGLRHLTTAPEICDFCVAWCAGASPEVSGDLLPQPIPFSNGNAEALSARFSELEGVFREAVAAWAPWHARA